MIYNGHNIEELMLELKHVMLDRNINITELSKRMHKSKQTVSNLLNGRTENPTLATLLELVVATECKLDISIVPVQETDAKRAVKDAQDKK